MLNFNDYIERRLEEEVLKYLAQQGQYSLDKLGVMKDAYKQAFLAYNYGEDIANSLKKSPTKLNDRFTTETINNMLMNDWNSKAAWQIAKDTRNNPQFGMTANQQMLKSLNDSYNSNKLVQHHTKARKMSDFDNVWGQKPNLNNNLNLNSNPVNNAISNFKGFGQETAKTQKLTNTPIKTPTLNQNVQPNNSILPPQQSQTKLQQTKPYELNATKSDLDGFDDDFKYAFRKTVLNEFQNGSNMFGKYITGLKNLVNSVNTTYKKYEGLTKKAAIQKAASKTPMPLTSREYYGIATHLADKENQETKVSQENDFYKLSNIQDKEKYQTMVDKIVKSRKLDPNDPNVYNLIKDTTIVTPKDEANLTKLLKNSTQLENFVAENYEKLKADKKSKIDTTVKFPTQGFDLNSLNRFATIHLANINNARVNDDESLSLDWNDYYDFEYMKNNYNEGYENNVKNTILTSINNTALEQQEKNQLEPYLIFKSMNLSKEEIEEILERRKKRLHFK